MISSYAGHSLTSFTPPKSATAHFTETTKQNHSLQAGRMIEQQLIQITKATHKNHGLQETCREKS